MQTCERSGDRAAVLIDALSRSAMVVVDDVISSVAVLDLARSLGVVIDIETARPTA